MVILNDERLFSESEIVKVIEKHANEIALNNLLKTELIGDVAIGMGLCLTHILKDLRIQTKEGMKVSDQIQTAMFGNTFDKEDAA